MAGCRDERTGGGTTYPARAGRAHEWTGSSRLAILAGRRWCLLGIALIRISTAVHVPRLVAGQANGLVGAKQFPWQMTAEQVAALEQQLAANPEDETVRKKLLVYYGFTAMCDQGIRCGLPIPPECRDRDVQDG